MNQNKRSTIGVQCVNSRWWQMSYPKISGTCVDIILRFESVDHIHVEWMLAM